MFFQTFGLDEICLWVVLLQTIQVYATKVVRVNYFLAISQVCSKHEIS